MRKKISIAIILLIAIIAQVQAADFEHRDVSVRNRALGNAAVSNSVGVDSISVNPAGVAKIQGREFVLNYCDEFSLGLANTNLSYAQPFLGGGLGLTLSNYGSDLDDLAYQVKGFKVSYAHALFDQLSVGVNLNSSALDSLGGTAECTTVDLGMMGTFGSISWGCSLFNATASASSQSIVESATQELVLGLSYRFDKSQLFAALYITSS